MSEDQIPEPGQVTLNFAFGVDDQIMLQCMMANARAGIAAAAKTSDMDDLIYYSASLAAYVDVLGLASPYRPPVNESDKP